MENSIEKDIKIIESMIEEYEDCSVPGLDMQVDITFREKQSNALKHILSDYKGILKENGELICKNRKLKNIRNEQDYIINDMLEYIPIKKVENKIAKLDEEIKNSAFPEGLLKMKQALILMELLEESEK